MFTKFNEETGRYVPKTNEEITAGYKLTLKKLEILGKISTEILGKISTEILGKISTEIFMVLLELKKKTNRLPEGFPSRLYNQ